MKIVFVEKIKKKNWQRYLDSFRVHESNNRCIDFLLKKKEREGQGEKIGSIDRTNKKAGGINDF